MPASEYMSMALLFDRKHLADARKAAEIAGGGGWAIGAKLFEHAETMQYLLMFVDSEERAYSASPRVALGADRATLHHMLDNATDILDGQTVKWIVKCEPETKEFARSIIEEFAIRLEPIPTISGDN